MSEDAGQEPTTTVDDSEEMSVEDLKAELAKVRREAASRRVAKKEADAELEQYRSWKESQKTEAQKAADRIRELEQSLTGLQLEKLRQSVAKKVGLDSDLADRIRGESEDEMLEDAKTLAKKYKSQASVDVYAGRRGSPVGSDTSKDPHRAFNDWVRNS